MVQIATGEVWNGEWTDVGAQEPIRQGDILRTLQSPDDPWLQSLIVITADCDLAFAKHNGSLSCVTVFHHLDYLRMFRIGRMIIPVERRIIDEVSNIVKDASTGGPKGATRPTISIERLSNWALEVKPTKIVEILRLSGDAGESVIELLTTYQSLASSRDSRELRPLINALVDCKLALREGKTKPKIRSTVVTELGKSFASLPGDAMFLTALGADANDGYVAYLRRIHELRDQEVVTSMLSIPQDAKFVRTGRLTAPYLFSLTQQVGSVFSSIGMPTEYEDRRREVSDSFAESHLEEM